MLNTKTIDSKDLLMNLSQYSHKITKIPVPAGRRFTELESFRKNIELAQHLPFNNAKRKVFTYKAIFYAFSLLFFILGAIILFKLPMLTYSRILFVDGYVIKNVMGPMIWMMGMASLWIGYGMSTEKEAALHILRQAKYNLSKSYARKKIEFGVNGFMHFGNSYTNSSSLKQSYIEARDQIVNQLHETYHLFDRIAQAPNMHPQSRVKLYNQSILEFNDKAERVLQSFNNVTID